MDYTYVDYFNYYLKQFLNELICTYPDMKPALVAHYRPFLENKLDKSDLYVKYYYTKINKYVDRITQRDDTLFSSSSRDTSFIEGIDFHTIWGNSAYTSVNRNAIWKYLQILMLLGRRIIPNHGEIVQLLRDITDGNISVPDPVQQSLLSTSDSATADDTDADDNSGSAAGLLGSLLQGIGGSVGGGASGGLGDLLKGFDMNKMMESVGTVFNNMSVASATTAPSDSTSESTAVGGHGGAQSPPVQEDDASASASATAGNDLFMDLASEMSDTLNLDGLTGDDSSGGAQPNMADIMKKVLTGDNSKKLFNLMGKYGSKLNDDIKNGRINQNELLQQTMNMMKNPNKVQERLRKKLEKKHNTKPPTE
jgi:hypothetical protein